MSIRVDRDQRSPTLQRMSAGPLLGWVLSLVASIALCLALFPRAFPLAPGDSWQLRPSEAKAIALERFTDLGDLPESPYVTAVLQRQRLLELQLLDTEAGGQSPSAADEILTWLVTVYPADAPSDAWTHQAELTLDGKVLRLLTGVAEDFSSRQQLTIEDAVSRADRLLERSGSELSDFYDPVERLVEMTSFSYQLLRYERRPPAIESEVTSARSGDSGARKTGVVGAAAATSRDLGLRDGIDVQFAADELLGFSTWQEFDVDAELDESLKRVQQIESAQQLLVFLLLAVVVTAFVYRYHQGLVGARRGTQVAVAILIASFWVLLTSARSVSEGWTFAGLSRSEITLAWIGLMTIVYLPALALLGGLSLAVGESLVRGPWRARLASFDGFASARWANATVASSSLRGVAAGVVLLALLLLAAIVSRHYGVRVPLSLQLGAPWESAQWPGVSLLLSQAALTTVALSFVLLFVVPQANLKFPLPVSFGLAALLLSFLFATPVVTVPAWGCLPTVLLSSVAVVALFVRYDFLVAWLAHLIA